MNIPREIQSFEDDLKRWRRDIHQHPELGFEEKRTASFVAKQLAEFGCEVHAGIGGTGVVGVLDGAQVKLGKTAGGHLTLPI